MKITKREHIEPKALTKISDLKLLGAMVLIGTVAIFFNNFWLNLGANALLCIWLFRQGQRLIRLHKQRWVYNNLPIVDEQYDYQYMCRQMRLLKRAVELKNSSTQAIYISAIIHRLPTHYRKALPDNPTYEELQIIQQTWLEDIEDSLIR